MILGICGRKRSGKDTVADYITEHYNFTRYGFADPIKRAVCEAFGWDQDEMEKPENKERVDPTWGISYRQALQDMGTDWAQLGLSKRYPEFKRVTGRTMWVKRFLQEVENYPEKNWVVSDIRFHHEMYELSKTPNFYSIKVTRPENNNIIDMHYSERDIDKLQTNCKIINDGTLDDLYDKVNQIMWKL